MSMEEPETSKKTKKPALTTLLSVAVLVGIFIASLGGGYLSVLVAFLIGTWIGFMVCLWARGRRE